MDNTRYIALSKQTGIWRELNVVANNLANMNTSGFKAEQPLFTEYLQKIPSPDTISKETIRFTQDYGTVRDFSTGDIMPTDNPLDVAINNDGFFVLDTPEGERYTRKGQFQLDNEGALVTSEGSYVLSEDNAPFFFSATEREIMINKDGSVSTENGYVGKLKLVDFANKQKLLATHSGLYTTTSDNPPQEMEDITIAQGMIEKSNVSSVTEMTKMIDLHRSFNNIQKMIENEHQRQSRAIDVLAGV